MQSTTWDNLKPSRVVTCFILLWLAVTPSERLEPLLAAQFGHDAPCFGVFRGVGDKSGGIYHTHLFRRPPQNNNSKGPVW